MIFERIYNDKEIIDRYKEVEEFEDNNQGYAYHNIEHINNVISNVEKLLTDLGYDNKFIEEAKIAALLHDTGANTGKEGHADRSYLYAKDYLKRKDIHLENETLVLDAIKNHSSGFDTDNIILLVLILSDKLDVKKNRITKYGASVIGNRQYGHIIDIDVRINDSNFIVNFKSDNSLDIKELEEYYFTTKIFKAIKAFSNKMNFTPIVYLDNKEWNMFTNF